MKNRVFIGTPAYDGRCHVTYALMLMDLSEKLKERGYEVMIRIPTMGSLLVANRNRLIQTGMEAGADWFVFIDSDVALDAEHIIRVIEEQITFFGGVYPLRDNKTFIFRPETEKNGRIKIDSTQNYLKMAYVPAGCLVFKREVIETMQKMFPHLHYDSKTGHDHGYAFFNTEVIDGEFWGEDYVFCRHVRECGYEILTDPAIVFNHAGAEGALIDVLTNDPEKAQKVVI